ncbi:MAG: histidinol-phosphate transaminase [Actinomycetota bacterium]|nr:histidinol-phosphate transaminase [Actinomycetota bacterium]
MRPFEIRDDLRELPPYRAPQVDAPVRLNTNESPYPPPERFFEELAARVRELDLNRYPDRDATALRRALGERDGWPAEGVFAAHGSNEILQTLFLTFGGPGRTLVTFEPTYSMYAQIARVTGTAHVQRELPEPWTLDEQTAAWGLSFEQPAITMICSPNNPTGNAYPPAVVRAALEATQGLVVVDEAYIDFGATSARALLDENERLVIVRSLSKSWRLAGARLGYLLAHPWLVQAIQVARLPYHLSAMAQLVGEVALHHDAAMLRAVGEVVAERDRLAKELARVPGVEVFPSDANFILFRVPRDGATVWKELAQAGVLVRDFSDRIPGALRVTVSTADENAAFVEALRSVLIDE